MITTGSKVRILAVTPNAHQWGARAKDIGTISAEFPTDGMYTVELASGMFVHLPAGMLADLNPQVGDTVRSYDYPDRFDCYVEGELLELTEPMDGCRRYKIAPSRVVWHGKHDVAATTAPHDRGHIFPPVNGTYGTLHGELNNVEVLNPRVHPKHDAVLES